MMIWSCWVGDFPIPIQPRQVSQVLFSFRIMRANQRKIRGNPVGVVKGVVVGGQPMRNTVLKAAFMSFHAVGHIGFSYMGILG